LSRIFRKSRAESYSYPEPKFIELWRIKAINPFYRARTAQYAVNHSHGARNGKSAGMKLNIVAIAAASKNSKRRRDAPPFAVLVNLLVFLAIATID
jgi:hypothetical protein